MCKYHMNTVILSVLSVQGGLHYLHIEKPNLGEKLEELMKKQDCACTCDLHSVFIHSIASEQATTLSSDSTQQQQQQQQQPAVVADEEVDSDEPKASNTALTVLILCSIPVHTLAAMNVSNT